MNETIKDIYIKILKMGLKMEEINIDNKKYIHFIYPNNKNHIKLL